MTTIATGEALLTRGLRPAVQLAAVRPHGDRLKYMGGCRCFKCRRANSNYERERKAAREAGDWNGIVEACAARRHMLKLARLGIGRRSIAAATDVAESVLHAIRTGRKRRIRARTERKILAVTKACAPDSASVSARKTWQRIEALLEEGFTKTQLARMLGSTARKPALQIGRDSCSVRTAARVEAIYRRYMQ
jgi:hypothetical protein